MKTSDIVLGSKVMALLVGHPGKGKTLAGASFNELGPVEFIDFDNRMAPVRLHMPDVNNINFDKFNVSNFEDFAYNFMPKLLTRNDYKTVHLAGITSLTMTAITYQMLQKTGGDKLKKTKGGLMVPSWDEFNGEAMIVSQVLDILKALSCNVLVEAHPVSRINITDGGKYTSLVAFGPKVESLIPGYFDEIWYFATETDMNGALVYKVYTRPSNEYPNAKTSLPLPPSFTLSNDTGKPVSLYGLIQEELRKYNIQLGGNSPVYAAPADWETK